LLGFYPYVSISQGPSLIIFLTSFLSIFSICISFIIIHGEVGFVKYKIKLIDIGMFDVVLCLYRGKGYLLFFYFTPNTYVLIFDEHMDNVV